MTRVSIALLGVLLTGCQTVPPYVPTAEPGDCYIAGRGVIVDPTIGATLSLDGFLVKGAEKCAEFFRAIKETGVDLRDYVR